MDEFCLALGGRSRSQQEVMDALALLFGGIEETNQILVFTEECQAHRNRDTTGGWIPFLLFFPFHPAYWLAGEEVTAFLLRPDAPLLMSTPDSKDDATLYDPPDDGGDVIADGEDEEELHLELSRELAQRLMEVADHVGISPSMVAARAIDLVCDEIGVVEQQDLSSGTMIQKYQTRLDLIHTLDFDVKQAVEDERDGAQDDEATQWTPGEWDEEAGWDAVERIIEAGEEAGRS